MTTTDMAVFEQVVVGGDLANITPEQRVDYYQRVCESLGLNPLTKPFLYIKLNGKLTLYASKDATEQLRATRGISILSLRSETIGDVYMVTATAKDNRGRTDVATGAVPLQGVKGEALANAYMKAETKAKRRVTLSLSGLGMIDESEVDSIPGAVRVEPQEPRTATPAPMVDEETGEIVEEGAFGVAGPVMPDPGAQDFGPDPEGRQMSDAGDLKKELDADGDWVLKNVGELMTYANNRWGSSSTDILGALGVERPGQITDPNDARRQLDMLWGDSD